MTFHKVHLFVLTVSFQAVLTCTSPSDSKKQNHYIAAKPLLYMSKPATCNSLIVDFSHW